MGKVGEILAGAIRKTIGPVIKAVIKPETYDLASHIKGVREAGLKNIINAVRKNKPLYSPSYPGREAVYSASLGQPVSKGLRKRESKAVDVFTNKKGNITHFGLKPDSDAMNEVAMNVAERRGLLSEKKYERIGELVESTSNHSIMGGYNLKIPAKGKGPATYQDKWDFAVNKGEKLVDYLDKGQLNKKPKSNRVTKILDNLISKTNKLQEKHQPSKLLSKTKSGLETAKFLAQPETSRTFAVNKARNMLDQVVKHQEIKGDLIAPSRIKSLSSQERTKHVKKYIKADNNGNTLKAVKHGIPLMYDDLLRRGVMKPPSAYRAPQQAVIKDVAKSKFFGISSPKKVVQDLKETKWEQRRAINTLAKKKVVKQTTKQHNIAKRNAVVLGAQATTATAATATALIAPNKNKNKK